MLELTVPKSWREGFHGFVFIRPPDFHFNLWILAEALNFILGASQVVFFIAPENLISGIHAGVMEYQVAHVDLSGFRPQRLLKVSALAYCKIYSIVLIFGMNRNPIARDDLEGKIYKSRGSVNFHYSTSDSDNTSGRVSAPNALKCALKCTVIDISHGRVPEDV